MKTAVLLAALALTLAAGFGFGQPAPAPLHVLFLGNSLTAVNDLPTAVEELAAAGGRSLDADALAPGGFSLGDHWRSSGDRRTLATGGYDYVVMQQGPSSLPASRLDLIAWTKRWAGEARADGVVPVLWTVWAESYRQSYFADVIRSYGDAARAASAHLYPVGVAWRHALRRWPGLGLYARDGLHPSPRGTYLAAAVIAGCLTGSIPDPLPLRLGGRSFAPAKLRLVRRAALVALRARR